LFKPYWRILSFSVIKDIINKPQKAQQLADLTEQSVRQLLVLTQAYTLPHLVLTKRRDIIEKIAQARKVSVTEVLTQPRNNLAKILALLLSQPVPDAEYHAMETLAAIEPAMREGSNNKLEALVALDITGIAIEILMLSAEQDDSKKEPVSNCEIHVVDMLTDMPVSSRICYTCSPCRYEEWTAQILVENQNT
jgi:serine/threonine-protein kinase ATR